MTMMGCSVDSMNPLDRRVPHNEPKTSAILASVFKNIATVLRKMTIVAITKTA